MTDASSLQPLRPPRIVEEFSSQIGQTAPAALQEISGHVRAWEKSIPPSAIGDYARDFWQRCVLFLDILRERGNAHEEMITHGATSVLIYDSELVMRGDELPHPVNYSLLRIIPPEGVEIDDRKRPIYVIDPRAGQGPGIGGFKQLSEIGEAFKAGHPVYFAGFAAVPVEGQRIEDVARAHTTFLAKVAELHPEALGKPFVFGNCQAGWHAMLAACMRPELIGPIVVAGTPLSYWAGVHGKNAMRYLGGWYGGSWLDRIMSDMGNGIFDAAWLVANFDNLNPANTFWTKQYNVWVNPEQEKGRYLAFEKWWGDFVVLRGEEMQWMVDNLFIGNKFSTGQIVTSDGIRLDLREIKAPIVCFCSRGDNITPPQQALDWILDNYQSVDEIRECRQRIFYTIDATAGHLAIFVGTKIAAKDHAQFINNMELIDAMPPGLYEIVITEKPGDQAEAADFDLAIEERGLDDIRALGCNTVEDEREFAAAARISELNNALYQAFLQPWIKMVSGPQLARAVIELNPLRLGYSMFSDKNPMMRVVGPMAEQVMTERSPASADNPLFAMQQQFSKAMVHALNVFRDVRDEHVERTFHAVYGLPLVQAACGISQNDGPPRPRPGLSPSVLIAAEKEKSRLKGKIAEGNALDAAARALVYVGKAQHRIERSTFDALRKLLLAYPEVTETEFKTAVREQWAILAVDERAAIEALPRLLPPDVEARRAFSNLVQTTLPAIGKLNVEGQRRFTKVVQLLPVDTAGHAGEMAAE